MAIIIIGLLYSTLHIPFSLPFIGNPVDSITDLVFFLVPPLLSFHSSDIILFFSLFLCPIEQNVTRIVYIVLFGTNVSSVIRAIRLLLIRILNIFRNQARSSRKQKRKQNILKRKTGQGVEMKRENMVFI